MISLYDNSAHGTEQNDDSEVNTAPPSSGKTLRLDTKSWTAELIVAYFPPDDLLSKSQGITQVLPGGNVLVNWGSEGALTEYKVDGTPVFHAYVDSRYHMRPSDDHSRNLGAARMHSCPELHWQHRRIGEPAHVRKINSRPCGYNCATYKLDKLRELMLDPLYPLQSEFAGFYKARNGSFQACEE